MHARIQKASWDVVDGPFGASDILSRVIFNVHKASGDEWIGMFVECITIRFYLYKSIYVDHLNTLR